MGARKSKKTVGIFMLMLGMFELNECYFYSVSVSLVVTKKKLIYASVFLPVWRVVLSQPSISLDCNTGLNEIHVRMLF